MAGEPWWEKGSSEERRERFARAKTVLNLARRLRADLTTDLAANRFMADDIKSRLCGDLVVNALSLFPDDPILKLIVNGLDQDKLLNPESPPLSPLPASGATERVLAHLDRLILRLDMIFGVWFPEEPERPQEPLASARVVLATQRDRVIREVLASIRRGVRVSQQSRQPPIEDLSFEFMRSEAQRAVLILDYREAQRAYYGTAYKLSVLAAGGTIEAMLMDAMQWPGVVQRPEYPRAVKEFPRKDGAIEWGRVSMSQLIKAASAVGLLHERIRPMAEAAQDFRDTVHPNREVLLGTRAGPEEALLFLALVQLIHRDLAAHQMSDPAES